MKMLGKSLGKFCAAATIAASMSAVTPANAEVIQLGFILDGSGSIGAGNWATIVNGLSTAVNTLLPVGGANTYEVSVVTFSSGATININSYTVNTLAQRSTLATLINTLPYQNGVSTNFASAFSAMRTALTDTVGTNGFIQAGAATKSYVNFATDGLQNAGGTGQTERNSLTAAGVDNISIEGIGSGVDAADLKANFCYPGPCDDTQPFNFPTQGFYIAVANATEYAAAIGNKIKVVTGQVPEPGTLALLGIAFAGLGFSRRKKIS